MNDNCRTRLRAGKEGTRANPWLLCRNNRAAKTLCRISFNGSVILLWRPRELEERSAAGAHRRGRLSWPAGRFGDDARLPPAGARAPPSRWRVCAGGMGRREEIIFDRLINWILFTRVRSSEDIVPTEILGRTLLCSVVRSEPRNSATYGSIRPWQRVRRAVRESAE